MSAKNGKSLSLNTASALLEISPVTLRNWVKAGLVPAAKPTSPLAFAAGEILSLKRKIQRGEVTRLRKRANKNHDQRLHSHSELLGSKENEELLLELLKKNQVSEKEFLYALYLSALWYQGLAHKKNIQMELKAWDVDTLNPAYQRTLEMIRTSDVDFSDNVLGFAYQALSCVGNKQKKGAYYTPPSLSERMVTETISQAGLFLDPCCGGGNFIVAAYHRLVQIKAENPHKKVFGQDSDLQAVLVARGYLTLATKGKADSVRQIVQGDALVECFTKNLFDFICTNPPWGAKFSASQKKELQRTYPEISSGESYSYFIISSLRKLKAQGLLNFVLPESFLNVKMHQDIRHCLLTNYKLVAVQSAKEKFSGVFTKALTLTVQKKSPKGNQVALNRSKISQTQLLKSQGCCIPIWEDTSSAELLAIIESGQRLYLKDHAEWALGIVTGDNERHLKKNSRAGDEGVLRGGDIFRFRTAPAKEFLRFERTLFQQAAPEEKYRTPVKLIYRFICKELVFAVDRQQRLTLNSANILLPKVPGYSPEALCAVLNSKLMQFYYQNKFHSIKTLRGNLECLPLPVASPQVLCQIETWSLFLEKKYDDATYMRLNEAVMDIYDIPERLRRPIRELKLSSAFF